MHIHRTIRLATLLLASSNLAHAACDGSTTLSGCFDAVPLTGPSEPSPFMQLGLSRGLVGGQLALRSGFTWANRPAELVAASPDPNGKQIAVVEHSLRFHLRAAYGLGRRFDLLGSLGAAVAQKGVGSEAVSTQRPSALDTAGFADPSVGLRVGLPLHAEQVGWSLRATTTLPLGHERAYAGANSFEPTLATNLSWVQKGWFAAADAGLTVARAVRFGDVRLGTNTWLGLGVAQLCSARRTR